MQPLFPIGRVVPPEDLVGREPAIAELVNRLLSGQSVIIAGPRRIGKTSVVEEALRRLRSAGHYAGRVDLLRVTSVQELVESIADACLGNLTKTRRALHTLREWVRGRVPEVQFRAALGPHAELALSFAAQAESRSEGEMLEDALALPQEMAARSGVRFFLAYDEFQEVVKLNSGLLGRMRALMILQDRVTFVFLGSRESMIQKLFVKKNEPFYRFAVEWHLPPVPDEAWRSYLLRKYREAGFDPVSETAVRDLVRLAGGHPMDTMLLANETVLVARETAARSISADMVTVAFERTMNSLARAFDEVWQDLDDAARHVLKRLAAGEPPYAPPAPNPGRVKRAIDRLLAAGILERPARGRYRFVETMFAEHIRRETLA
ncbi:MAG TPA: ATP-binding protein [Bacillota bacterium]